MYKIALQFQICFFPFFDGGFYINGPHGPMNRMFRISLGVIDLRIWWDDRRGQIPFQDYANKPVFPVVCANCAATIETAEEAEKHTCRLRYAVQVPAAEKPGAPVHGFYFGSSSGNTAEWLIHAVWENQPTDTDLEEITDFAKSAGPSGADGI